MHKPDAFLLAAALVFGTVTLGLSIKLINIRQHPEKWIVSQSIETQDKVVRAVEELIEAEATRSPLAW